jgi:hypothetical protein
MESQGHFSITVEFVIIRPMGYPPQQPTGYPPQQSTGYPLETYKQMHELPSGHQHIMESQGHFSITVEFVIIRYLATSAIAGLLPVARDIHYNSPWVIPHNSRLVTHHNSPRDIHWKHTNKCMKMESQGHFSITVEFVIIRYLATSAIAGLLPVAIRA